MTRQERVRAWVVSTRAAQGLGPKITNVATLDGLAAKMLAPRDTNSGPRVSAARPALAVASSRLTPTAKATALGSSNDSGLLLGGAQVRAQRRGRTSKVESAALKGGGHRATATQ